MMSPAIRSVVAYGWVTAASVFLGNAGVAQPAADSTSQMPVLPCTSYANNTFLSDESVKSILEAAPGPGRPTVALPCTENVSFAEVTPVDPAQKPSAATGAMNSLFNATRTPLERLQNGFDFYSWLTFIALNSPQDPSARFGAPGTKTVWESQFLSLDQVMKLGDGQENFHLKSAFQAANLPQACLDAKKKSGIATEPTLFVSVDDVAFDQPFKTGPLIDQYGHYSLNTIFMSPEMSNYIKDEKHHLESFTGQQHFKDAVEFPPGRASPSEFGSMMIKASWRELIPKKDDFNEFHTARAYRYVPSTGSCDIPTLGLVGFHVVHKTEHRHQWIWTTFEHVRNVPSDGDLKAHHLEKAYFFFDAKFKPDNRPPEQPWDPAHPSHRKSQIVRAQDISVDTQTINKAAQSFLRSLDQSSQVAGAPPISNVWSHYQLISTQWPADFNCASALDAKSTAKNPIPVQVNQQADPNCSPAPQFLPNSTLETYIQHDIGLSGGAPQATSSCIACHNNAVAYTNVDYGDKRSLGQHDDEVSQEEDCKLKLPSKACSPASDFTFILEQVCAPMTDLRTGTTKCKRDH
jgi:hypothetical protein